MNNRILLLLVLSWLPVSCSSMRPPDILECSPDDPGMQAFIQIRNVLDSGGGTIDYDTLMHVYHSITESRVPIARIDQLLHQLIQKRNENPRIDQMVLIFSANAIGALQFPVQDAYGFFELILEQDERVNEWVISFVASAIGDYRFDIAEGDRLVDLLEQKLEQVRREADPAEEYFGYHFLPPPKSSIIQEYISGIQDQRIRQQERLFYYTLIQNNCPETEIEAALKTILSQPSAGDKQKHRQAMRYLLINLKKNH